MYSLFPPFRKQKRRVRGGKEGFFRYMFRDIRVERGEERRLEREEDKKRDGGEQTNPLPLARDGKR